MCMTKLCQVKNNVFLIFSAADKYIVCRSQLMSLFTICPACCEETQGKIEKQEGTFVKIKQVRGYLWFLVEKLNCTTTCIFCFNYILCFYGIPFTYISQVCAACGYQCFWQNQPMLHRNMPACNLLLSGAIHFSGCMTTQTIRMLKLFGLQSISVSTFFRHQRLYTIPTIVQAWQNEQAGVIKDLNEMRGGLILSGDCR